MLSGSPPLTRGQRNRNEMDWRRPGITPAHAGTTNVEFTSLTQVRDHPRSRGDNLHDAPAWE